jgi:DNA invertase Pin-like site-specific DNA recombinase
MTVASGYRFRALTPEQEIAVRGAHAAGARAADLAAAYGVSRQTIYRAVERAGRPQYEVHVGDRRASFEIEDGTPVQVAPWVPR